MSNSTAKPSDVKVAEARARLDAQVREVIAWHFDPQTGCPFWLEYAQSLGWDPRKEVQSYADLNKFPWFEDEWLRGGPVRRPCYPRSCPRRGGREVEGSGLENRRTG